MDRAGKLLGGVLRRLDRPEAALAWLASAWPKVVGKILAAHTKPIRCEAGRLEIVADGKAWQKQLESMKKEFCERGNQAWGGNLGPRVNFIAKPLRQRVELGMDNEHMAFIRSIP